VNRVECSPEYSKSTSAAQLRTSLVAIVRPAPTCTGVGIVTSEAGISDHWSLHDDTFHREVSFGPHADRAAAHHHFNDHHRMVES